MKARLLLKPSIISLLRRNINYTATLSSQPKSTGRQTTASTQPPPAPSANVPGLSEAVVKYGNEPVGPGAAKNTEYKNPEYFCYHVGSYYEAEIEMLKYRLPQPSSMQ